MMVKFLKPAVRPVYPGSVRKRSSALKKSAEALVPVFSGSTGGPVRFLKLCF
jgi:hypothetical protein